MLNYKISGKLKELILGLKVYIWGDQQYMEVKIDQGTVIYGIKSLRVYLKTGNMTNSEGFFAC